MRIEKKTEGGLVSLHIPIGISMQELRLWQEILRRIFVNAYKDRPLCAVTLAPQEYSLGYELGTHRSVSSGDNSLLVNSIRESSEELLSEMVMSDEFERGLLRVFSCEESIVERLSYEKLFSLFDENIAHITALPYEVMMCEDDGRSLYWINPYPSLNEAEQRIMAAINEIKSESEDGFLEVI